MVGWEMKRKRKDGAMARAGRSGYGESFDWVCTGTEYLPRAAYRAAFGAADDLLVVKATSVSWTCNLSAVRSGQSLPSAVV